MADMSNPPRSDHPPEGLLLEQARERMDISQNEAGRRAGITGTRWRQITYEQASEMTSTRGVKTIARMAVAVGVTPEQLAEVGREDVAELLRERKGEPSLAELTERLEVLEREAAQHREETEYLRRMLRDLTGKDSGSFREEEPESDKPRQAM